MCDIPYDGNLNTKYCISLITNLKMTELRNKRACGSIGLKNPDGCFSSGCSGVSLSLPLPGGVCVPVMELASSPDASGEAGSRAVLICCLFMDCYTAVSCTEVPLILQSCRLSSPLLTFEDSLREFLKLLP